MREYIVKIVYTTTDQTCVDAESYAEALEIATDIFKENGIDTTNGEMTVEEMPF